MAAKKINCSQKIVILYRFPYRYSVVVRPGESSNADSPRKGDTSPGENDSGADTPTGQGTHMILVSSVVNACHIFGREVR